MIEFILNDKDITTDQPPGTTVLDFVRYHKDLRGTKIGCREGDCGACTILVGELVGGEVKYRTMTSCLMPLANAAGKHIVTVEGVNPTDGSLTPVQQAMVDENGTQCGFCTVGFVMSLTGFCLDRAGTGSPHVSKGLTEMAISAVDGNICRCTGYKSIERAAERVCGQLADGGRQFVPKYFSEISGRLKRIMSATPQSAIRNPQLLVGGGTDVYVQKPDTMAESNATHVFYDERLRGIRDIGEYIEIGASTTVTDLLESSVMQSIFPDLYKHLKLVSSTPIRNMATLAGNFINASPIGDMTVWFLALDANVELSCTSPRISKGDSDALTVSPLLTRGLPHHGAEKHILPLRDLYLGYKQLAKSDNEYITTIRFRKPTVDFRFNFEKVCKRTYLDIATVNTAISLVLSEPGAASAVSSAEPVATGSQSKIQNLKSKIEVAHVAAGGVAPIPLYLRETSAFLNGREINEETIHQANEIMQSEISPISDVRGTESYKRLLLRQLFSAHFVELFGLNAVE